MKQASRLILASFVAIMLVLPFVMAATPLELLLKNVFGVQGALEISQTIVAIMIWMILFTAFTDLIYALGPFSKTTSWFIGFGLAVIAANVGWVWWFTEFAFSVVAGLGAAAVAIVLGSIFLLVIATYLGFDKFANWLRARKDAMLADKGIQNMKKGMDVLSEVGKHAKKK